MFFLAFVEEPIKIVKNPITSLFLSWIYTRMAIQQVSRSGGPNECFGVFQRAMECMTSASTKSNGECAPFMDDYVECRRHRLETYKATIVQEHLQQKGLDAEQLGAPYVKKREFLTPKTLGLVGGDDHSITVNKF